MPYFGILIVLVTIASFVCLSSLYSMFSHAYDLENAAVYEVLIIRANQLQLLGCNGTTYDYQHYNGIYIGNVSSMAYVVTRCNSS